MQLGSDKPKFTPTKTSIGVILCRKNVLTQRPEVLLVHKRYTYAFAEFVHGRYSRGLVPAVGTKNKASTVHSSLDNMSREELLDIYSLNFSQMWYRIWLSHDNIEFYHKKNARFQSVFMRFDGGAELRRLCLSARGSGALLWEVPKGRRLGPREPDIMCAVREMREETGVNKSEYRLLPGAIRRNSYISSGTRYVNIYFVAMCLPSSTRLMCSEYINTLRDLPNIAEISEVRWHDNFQIRQIDSDSFRLSKLLAPVFNLVHNYFAGRWSMKITPIIIETECWTEGQHKNYEHTGMEHTGMEHTGMEHTGMEHTGMEHTCMERTGMERTCIKHTGIKHTGIKHTCMERTCIKHTCMERTCIKHTCMERTCMERTCIKHTGIKHTGIKHTGMEHGQENTLEPPKKQPLGGFKEPIQQIPKELTLEIPTLKNSEAAGLSAELNSELQNDEPKDTNWNVVRSRRYNRSIRGHKAALRSRILIDTCVPSSTEVITDVVMEVKSAAPKNRFGQPSFRNTNSSWRNNGSEKADKK